MRHTLFLLYILTLISGPIFGIPQFGGGRAGGRKSAGQKKDMGWPGRYECEQCARQAGPAGTLPLTATPAPANACWKYEVTVLKYEDALRAQIEIIGPDGEKGMKSLVAPMGDRLDFNYSELIDTGKAPLPFSKGDLLLSLQHREDDYILRFKKLTSKVDGQTAITCQKK